MNESYQHPTDGRGQHPIEILTTTPGASPVDMDHPAYGDDVPFWQPDYSDIAKHLGWRWILFVPAFLVIGLIAALPLKIHFAPMFLLGGWKLLIIVVGIATAAAGTAVGSIVKQRTEPFCIHCGYDLTGLPSDNLCPECGRPFSLKLIEEYRRDPKWFIQRYKNNKTTPIADAPFAAGTVRRRKSRDGT